MKIYFVLSILLLGFFSSRLPETHATAIAHVCPLFPNGDQACKIVEDGQKEVSNLTTQEGALTGTDEETVKQRGALQTQIADKRAKIQNDMIEALSKADRTSGFKATLGLQVGNEGGLTLISPSGADNSNIWVPSRIIQLMAKIIGTFAILILAFGGLMMITSEGDENRLQNGKNIFFYTIVGLLVAFISYIGVQFIISVLFTTGGA